MPIRKAKIRRPSPTSTSSRASRTSRLSRHRPEPRLRHRMVRISHPLHARWRNPPRASPFSRGLQFRHLEPPAGVRQGMPQVIFPERHALVAVRPDARPRRSSVTSDHGSSPSLRTSNGSLWFRANPRTRGTLRCSVRAGAGPNKVEDALVEGNLRRVRTNLARVRGGVARRSRTPSPTKHRAERPRAVRAGVEELGEELVVRPCVTPSRGRSTRRRTGPWSISRTV